MGNRLKRKFKFVFVFGHKVPTSGGQDTIDDILTDIAYTKRMPVGDVIAKYDRVAERSSRVVIS